MCQYKTHSSINKQEDWQASRSAEGSGKFPTSRWHSRGGTVRTKFVRRKAQERFWAELAMSLDCIMREERWEDGVAGASTSFSRRWELWHYKNLLQLLHYRDKETEPQEG